jgi:hypothetical protein
MLGGGDLLLEAEDGEVETTELSVVGAVAGHVGQEPPVIEGAGGGEDLGPESGVRAAGSEEPRGEWLRDVLGSQARLCVEVNEVDKVLIGSHGSLSGSGAAWGLTDEARLEVLLTWGERDAEVREAAAILNEALRALWRGGRCAAEVELRVTILCVVAGLERVMKLLLVRGVSYDVLVGQGVKPILLVRVGAGDGLDDLSAVVKVEIRA